jgi:hypothetical protein
MSNDRSKVCDALSLSLSTWLMMLLRKFTNEIHRKQSDCVESEHATGVTPFLEYVLGL